MVLITQADISPGIIQLQMEMYPCISSSLYNSCTNSQAGFSSNCLKTFKSFNGLT